MKQISLNQIISGKYSNGEEMAWNERVTYFNQIKEYLLSTCRNGSKMYNAINNAWFENMETGSWEFERLCIYDGKAFYITGQDYSVEMPRVKKQFIK